MKKIIDNLKLSASSYVDDAVESMENVIDSGASLVKKSYNSTIIAFKGLTGIGVTLAFIIAPVPTTVAVSLMWVIGITIEDSNKSITLADKNKKQSKKTNRAILLLKKYGKIPKTATVETPYLSMIINSETGGISGTLLKGKYENKQLNELSSKNIKELINNDSDAETHDLLVAYLAYRDQSGV